MRKPRDEHGIALVVTLFLMATLSALAVSMMFLAQTETAASRNYRTMSQARYAAEAGIHTASNYLMNAYPASVPASPFNGYDTTKAPVTCTAGCTTTTTTTCNPTTAATASSTGCIVLSAIAGIGSNYPDATVAAAFNTAAQGTLAVNGSGTTTNGAAGTVTYGAAAILMSMRAVSAYGNGTTSVIQTWQIVSDGTVPPSTSAIVEVSAAFEREYGPADTYAVFATGDGCGSIKLNGNSTTNSYNSATMSTTPPSASDFATGGNLGTNGNLNVDNAVTVDGSLSSPRTGVGQCKSGGSVPAVTGTGSSASNITQGIAQLSQAVSYPTPDLPNPMPLVSPISISSTACTAIKARNPTLNAVTGCTVSGNTVSVITAGSTALMLDDLSVTSGYTLNISYGVAGTASSGTAIVNVNSVMLAATATVALGTGTSLYMNVAGKTSTGTDMLNPLSFSGSANVNPSYDPSRFQILYAGTGELDATGSNTVAATIYAPNAFVKTAGNGSFYGSILSKTFQDSGSTAFHYDRNLKKKLFTIGSYVMTSFSWKKY